MAHIDKPDDVAVEMAIGRILPQIKKPPNAGESGGCIVP